MKCVRMRDENVLAACDTAATVLLLDGRAAGDGVATCFQGAHRLSVNSVRCACCACGCTALVHAAHLARIASAPDGTLPTPTC